ncbi:eukaryotic translation initiation factor eIF-1A [Cyanidioschyzon merolae strain 10D]|uniref:Eukaryotic translation initiation factor 4C n=1 Tax=Cyanidioschyzon merolae (strain NIES-3377 / 10D) TaxID=280699 RepID=M1VG33_CYAM1|nr:eukaryotic translation initiation factor eIF-1A [Cyanidioschyzon merolae strain 10D]BAM82027.1 eukaryotic translation initiation factor eIF-1A [Cyanidioschyzon merolae strain 10D]|eukprot:XP_005538063.1 eukaryotic translation initiation factor eIF-1A [Cyanidioschyzon merolae strain 10D]
MPKNKGKGGKNRRRGKSDNDSIKREIVFKEDGQEYGQVLRMLGNGRCEIHCFDGQKRLGHIRGKMRKKVWVNAGDIVLVGLRDFQDDKCDIILKYSADESRALQRKGELPDNIVLNEATDTGDGAEVEFEVDFDEEEEVAKQPARGAMPELDIDDI